MNSKYHTLYIFHSAYSDEQTLFMDTVYEQTSFVYIVDEQTVFMDIVYEMLHTVLLQQSVT